MKFSCNQQVLAKALNIVSKAVSSRTTIPVLKGIVLKVDENGILTMAASDLDLSIEKSFRVYDYEPGETVVQAKLFGDIIRKLPNTEILIEENNDNVSIKCSNSLFNIVGSPSDEFPKINVEEKEENKIVFNKDVLKELIKKTSFAASIDESKGIITGVLVEIREGLLNMVSLDGFRMAVARKNIDNVSDARVIIPAKILNEISKIVTETEGEEENVEFIMCDKRSVFKLEGTRIVLRLLEGEFVRYNDIIPKESNTKIILNRGELLEGLERASLFAKIGKNNLVKLEISDDNMEITSKSEEGNVKENISIRKEGNGLTIGFNSKYLIDAIKVIDDEEITLLMNTSVSPCLIRPMEGNSYEYLVLPVRITNN